MQIERTNTPNRSLTCSTGNVRQAVGDLLLCATETPEEAVFLAKRDNKLDHFLQSPTKISP
jgi:hypothetical protein